MLRESRDSRSFADRVVRILAHLDIERAILDSWPDRISSEMFDSAGALEPVRKLASREAGLMTDDAWQSLAEQVMRSLTPTERNSPRESEIGLELVIWLERLANEHRRPGELDLARAITTRMQTFASKLAARFPDEAPAHLAVCLVFDAIAETALLADDRPTVERNWKLGLAKAHEAMLLDPGDDRIHAETAKLQGRLGVSIIRNKALAGSIHPDGKPISTGGPVQIP